MPARVIVVGSGPGGLASALLMRAKGAEVTLLERAPEVGGRSSALDVGGFRFDKGPTFFLYPRVLEEILAECGYDLAAEVELKKLDPLYDLVFEDTSGAADPNWDGRLTVHADPKKTMSEIAKVSPGDAAKLPALLAKNRTKLEAFKPALEMPFNGLSDLLNPAVLSALPHLKPWKSVDADLAEHFEDPRVRLAFSFQSKYLGMSPYRCPSLFTILAFLEHEHGVFHPTGGCGGLMERLADLARRMGVVVRTSTPVDELLLEGRRAVGVRAGAEEIRADAVVLNADFGAAMRDLVPDAARKRWSDAKLERKKWSCSTFMLYMGLEGPIELAHHTILLAKNYRRNLAEIEDGAIPTDPSLYVQNACVTDPGQAPAGHSTLYALVPVPHLRPGQDWADLAPAFRRTVLERLELLGLKDLERRVKVERVLTPAGWADSGIYKGATFNLAHNLGQMLCFRPRNRFEEIDGVYLAGGGTHPGSGLPVIFEGARIACKLAAEDLGLDAPGTEMPMEPGEAAKLASAAE